MGTEQVQERLFHEDWRDTLSHVVKALGGFEAVGIELWPTKTRKAAGNWLSDCLNGDRPAKLDLEEIETILKLGREKGVHTAMYYLTEKTGYERPQIAAPKSPRTVLSEKRARLAAEMAEVDRDIDRLDAAEGMRRVK